VTWRRLVLGATAATVAAVAALLGGVIHGSAGRAAPRAGVAQPGALAAEFAASNTATYVAQLQDALRMASANVRGLGLLGLAYEQRARETGDPTYYTKADGVLRRALRLAPSDLIATGGLGSLALSRHRFRDALTLGLRARRLSPTTAQTYGLIGDALLELGQYGRAFAAFDRLARLKPGLTAYARVSYARELVGDYAGATAAMKLALGSAVGEREALAWTDVQLGKLYWSHGDVGAAAHEDRAALLAFHGYPQYVATFGDLLARAGRRDEARRQYALIGAIRKLLAANGVRTDLETALFDVDHGVQLRDSVSLARRARAERPSIDGDDVLAWALMRSGRCGEALVWSRHSLRLGTQDALKFFHRGAIERCLGNRTAAHAWLRRALALNPHFSLLWAPVARRWLR